MANEIFTRIQLKYDSYDNWTAANTLLLEGEIAIAYLGVTHTTTSPDNGTHPVLFKVGPGKFNDLPWASALAADVYAWAKAEDVRLKDQKLEFFTTTDKGDVVAKTVDLTTFATEAEVEAILAGYKKVQTAVADPTANGKSLTFIDTISQDKQGVITATKKNVNLDDYALKSEIPTEFGVMSVDKINNTAIKVDNTDPANPEVGLLIDPNPGNVVLSQSNSGLKAEIDLGDYALKSELHAPTTVAQGVGITVTDSGDRNYTVAHADTSSVANVTKTDRTYVSGITFDDFGHVTAIATGVETDQHIAEYSIVKDATSEYAATYHLTKDGENIGAAINIPKDMVVEKGEVKTLEAGTWGNAGTYIVLTLSNATNDKLYINVGDLIEYVTSGSTADSQVIINIDDQHKVTATIGAGKVGTTELANNAVVTSKVADKNITLAKLADDVITAINKDDDTTYAFADGTDGSFTVTPKGGSAQKVNIGKPAEAGHADTAGAANVATHAGTADVAYKLDTTKGDEFSTRPGTIIDGASIRFTGVAGDIPYTWTNDNVAIGVGSIQGKGKLTVDEYIGHRSAKTTIEGATVTTENVVTDKATIGGVEIEAKTSVTDAIKYLVFNCGSATVLVD